MGSIFSREGYKDNRSRGREKEEERVLYEPPKEEDICSFSYFNSLSEELQLLIMSKLPVQSLAEFRRVSKTWRSWIYKEHFFFGKCPQRTDGFFLLGGDGFPYIPLPDSDNYNYNEEEDLEEFYPAPPPPPTFFFPFPKLDWEEYIPSFKFFHDASNGLLLLSPSYREELFLHNPLTRQNLLLPMSSRKFSANPLWIGYEPHRSPYFYLVHKLPMPPGSNSQLLQIFSSRSWTWCDLITHAKPTYSQRSCVRGRAVTYDGLMFIDFTFYYSIILVVDLRTKKDYVSVPLPPGLPSLCRNDPWSVLGMCEGNIMYAYSQRNVLLVYKLLFRPLGQGFRRLEQGGDYRWTLLIEDTSLQDRIARKFGTAPTYHVMARDFLLHVPVLLITSTCSVTERGKVFSYNFTNGSILELYEPESSICRITSLSLCPLEIYSGGKERKKQNDLKIREERGKKEI